MTQHHHNTEYTPDENWASPAGYSADHAQQWQGQASHYYDSAQHYYDPNNPNAWHQATQYPNGRPAKKSVWTQWWFITIVIVMALGVAAIVLVLTNGEQANDAVAPPSNPETAPLVPEEIEVPEDTRVQRSDDGQFILADAGTDQDALAAAQERLDAGYSYYGPTDLIDMLRYEGYQNDAIEYALNHLTVDWNEQAVGVAQRMADNEYGGYSAKEMQESLLRSGFIADEVQHVLESIDVDFNEQALQALESYREVLDDYTDAELRVYLERTGFQDPEIDYALDNID